MSTKPSYTCENCGFDHYGCLCRSRRNRAASLGLNPDVVIDAFREFTGCEICGATSSYRDWDIDHDHDTGEFRGLLCYACNSRLKEPLLLHLDAKIEECTQQLQYYLRVREYLRQ